MVVSHNYNPVLWVLKLVCSDPSVFTLFNMQIINSRIGMKLKYIRSEEFSKFLRNHASAFIAQ